MAQEFQFNRDLSLQNSRHEVQADLHFTEPTYTQEIVVVDDFIRVEHFNPKNRHETQYIAINRRYIISVHKTKQTFETVEHDVYIITVEFGDAISSFYTFDNPLKDLDL